MKELILIFFVMLSGFVFGQSESDSSDVKQKLVIEENRRDETKEILYEVGKYKKFFNLEAPDIKINHASNNDPNKGPIIDYKEIEMGLNQYDSRIEIRNLDPIEENNISILKNARTVGCLIDAKQLEYVGDSVYMLDLSQAFGKTYRLCPDEPYYSEPTVGFGTAFFIDNDKIITALHCFDNINIKDVYFLLGYVLANIDGTISPEFGSRQVFKIKKIIRRIVNYDIVILQLDKPYCGFFPPISRNFEYTLRNPIYALGYPMGLPLKLMTNASIKSIPDNFYVYTTLDTYHGNSGSPVFDKETNEIIGILLEGGVDFVNQGNCNKSYLCARSDCLGEKVLRLSTIIDEIITDK
jgi:hypothetical protein